ncbi:MAG: AraC family transcriptional regulator [Kiritimatiellia bacterium]
MIRTIPIKAVKDVVSQGGLTHLEYARASRCGIPDNVSIVNAPRLLTTLRGAAAFQVTGCDGIRRIVLKPGEGIYVPATYWVKADPARSYQTLGLIFHKKLTRLYVMEAVQDDECWHTRMLAADERAALAGILADSLFELLNKPGDNAFSLLRERAAVNLLLAECSLLIRSDDAVQTGGKAWQHWQAARHYVDEHLQEPLDRQRVADALQLHPNHLSRLFKTYDNFSFSNYITQARMNRAELLLADSTLNVSDVAYLSGFASPNYFIRLYRRQHGCSPGKDRISKTL